MKEKFNSKLILGGVLLVILIAVAIFFFSKSSKQSSSSTETEKVNGAIAQVTENLSDVAKKFARSLENNDIEQIYQDLTPERRSAKTKEEFIKLWQVTIGSFTALTLTGTEESEDIGFVKYENEFHVDTGTWYFKKVDGKWYFDGFSLLLYSGCFNAVDCTAQPQAQVLDRACKSTCAEKGESFVGQDLSQKYTCQYHLCSCICYAPSKTAWPNVLPDTKFLTPRKE